MFVCQQCGELTPGDGVCPLDGGSLRAVAGDEFLGKEVGPYRLVALLGVGGMGRVYEAVELSTKERVAIKVFSQSSDSPLVERFLGEARAASAVDHEGIVRALGAGRLRGGRPYLVMELLEGCPLSRALGHLDLATAITIALDVLTALQAAHEGNIVHRDLKPENIFLNADGRAVLLDFGIAKLLDESTEANRTTAGALLGTPHYMAPEQAEGRLVDARTDIYAMGVILFECTTGRLPFAHGSVFQILQQHVSAQPPAPRDHARGMSKALEEVILKAMAKEPEARFANSRVMAEALRACPEHIEGEEARLLPAELPPRREVAMAPRFDEFYAIDSHPSDAATVASKPTARGGSAATQGAGRLAEAEASKKEAPSATRRFAQVAVVSAVILGGGFSWWALSGDSSRQDMRVASDGGVADGSIADAAAADGPAVDAALSDARPPDANVPEAPREAATGVTVEPTTLLRDAERAAEAVFADARLVQIKGQPVDARGRINLSRGVLDFFFLSPSAARKEMGAATSRLEGGNTAASFGRCAVRVRFRKNRRPSVQAFRFDCRAALPSRPCPLAPLLRQGAEELPKLGGGAWRLEYGPHRRPEFPSRWRLRGEEDTLDFACRR